MSYSEMERLEKIVSDGSKNKFYQIPEWVEDCDDLAEYLSLNSAMGNILKTMWVNIGVRHDGTDPLREAKKRVHYASRELERINK